MTSLLDNQEYDISLSVLSPCRHSFTGTEHVKEQYYQAPICRGKSEKDTEGHMAVYTVRTPGLNFLGLVWLLAQQQ